MKEILTLIEPLLAEFIVGVVAAALYRLLDGRVARETLHSALQTGVEQMIDALEDGRITRQELIDIAVRYAQQSSPGSVKRLKPTESVMRDLAAAKLNGALRGTVRGP